MSFIDVSATRKIAQLFVLVSVPAWAQVSQLEREALIDLYNATSGPDWIVSENWLGAEGTECSWHGVTCVDDSVYSLNLSSNGLYGSIPSSISSLVNLDTLWLSSNQLSGTVPSSLGQLVKLRQLSLQINELTGEIPSSLSVLSELEILYLDRNTFSGSLPAWIGGMSALRYLNLGQNALTGPLPEAWSDLSLEHLNLRDIQIGGQIPEWISGFNNLSILDLHNTGLSGALPEWIGQMSALQWISLGQNQFSGSIPLSWSGLSGLRSLQLSGSNIGGQIPDWIAGYEHLQILDLRDTGVMGPLPTWLGQMSSMTSIYLGQNQLFGPIPESWASLSNLRSIDLSGISIGNEIPEWFSGFADLENLSLHNSNLSGSLPAWIGQMSSMRHLSLGANQFSGEIPNSWVNLSALKGLYLNNNLLSGPVPSWLSEREDLVGLSVRNNCLHASPPEVQQFLDKYDDFWFSQHACIPDDAAIRNLLPGFERYDAFEHVLGQHWMLEEHALRYYNPAGQPGQAVVIEAQDPRLIDEKLISGAFSSRVSVSQVGGDPGYVYGLNVICYRDQGLSPVVHDMTRIAVTPGGYRIDKNMGGGDVIKDWTAAGFVTGNSDVVSLVRNGAVLSFAINGNLLLQEKHEQQCDYYSVGLFSSANVSVLFDNFLVSIPEIDGSEFGSRVSLVSVIPTPNGQPNEYTFTVILSAPLEPGQYVALNFDNLQGGWFAQGDAGGHVPMNCSGTTCTVNRVLDMPGLRAFRAGVFDASDNLLGAYSGGSTCTLPECIAAIMAPSRIGNPALSGSGSQLVRGVDVATGNYHLSSTDLSVSGKGPDFVLMRAYNALTGSWSFNLDAKAAFVADSYSRRITIAPREDGRSQTFFKDIDNKWYALNPGNFDRLVEESDGRFTLYTQGNLLYRFADPDGAGAGRLEAIADRDGNVLSFSHTANRITGATDASGRAYTLTRDGGGRITSASDFAGRSVQYTWTAAGITSARNLRNESTTYTYSGQQLTAIADPRGNVQASIAYVPSGTHAGKVASVTDGAGNAWSYTYTTTPDAQGRHGTGVSRPATHGVNNNLLFAIDSERTRVLERVDSVNAGDFRRKNDFASAASRQRIAEAALVTRSEQPNGAATAIHYQDDGTGNPLTISASGSGVSPMATQLAWTTVPSQTNLTPMQSLRRPGVATATQFGTFTASGKARSIVDPLGHSSARNFNAAGLLTSSTDARGGTTGIQYDSQGRPTHVTDALGHTTVTEYDNLGRVTRVTNARGHSTHYTYDANGNVLTVTDALGAVTTHTYDASDNLVQTVDARGNTTAYVYDNLNRKVSETYTAGGQQRTRSFAYDAMGRLYRVTNEKGHASETRFDARGNTLQEINPLSQTVTYTYDANGNVTSVTDAEGRTVSYQYDALDRKTRATDALNHYEAYTYNAQGLLASKRDARGQTTQYEYDALGRMTRVIDADGGETRATYDANGNLTSTTDRKNQTVAYTYDAGNRMTRLTDPMGRQWNFVYDANGNLTSRQMPDGSTIGYTYDALDRVSSVSYPGGPNVSYTYDANGNRLSMIDGHGTTTYGYDELNRLVAMNDAFGNSVAWRYDAAGLLDRLTYPGNRNVSYSYDAAGRMTALTDWLGHTTSYTRDASGAVRVIQYGNGARVDKTYDAAGRLVSLLNRNAANGTISSHSLTLDGAGNPTSASLDLPLLPTNLGRAAEMLYDASNRMTHIGGVAVTHDTLGRLTADPSGGDPIQYAYNAQDLITSVTRGGVLTDSYAYDGDGRRVARNSNGQTTRYVLDPTGGDLYRLLAETNAANAVQYYYVYGDGGLVSQISGSSHRYYHFDQTGNTLALTNSSGSVTDTYAYEPFGNTTTQGNSHNPFRFVGQFGVMDDGNGLHHMRARYYRPDLRRFVSLDALYGQVDDPMTLNRYQYVSGNPMVGVDPSGYECLDISGNYTYQSSSYRRCEKSFTHNEGSLRFSLEGGRHVDTFSKNLHPLINEIPNDQTTGRFEAEVGINSNLASAKLLNVSEVHVKAGGGLIKESGVYGVDGGAGVCASNTTIFSGEILGIRLEGGAGPSAGLCATGSASIYDKDGYVGLKLDGVVAKKLGLSGGAGVSVNRNKGVGKAADNFGRWVYRVTH